MMEDRSSLRPYVDIWKKCKAEGDKRISFAASKIKVMKDKLNELKTIESKTLEYEYIDAAYQKYGNVRDAAKSLGMSAATLTRKKNKKQ